MSAMRNKIVKMDLMKQNSTSSLLPNKVYKKNYSPKIVEIMNIIGRVTADAQVHSVSNNKKVVNFQ